MTYNHTWGFVQRRNKKATGLYLWYKLPGKRRKYLKYSPQIPLDSYHRYINTRPSDRPPLHTWKKQQFHSHQRRIIGTEKKLTRTPDTPLDSMTTHWENGMSAVVFNPWNIGTHHLKDLYGKILKGLFTDPKEAEPYITDFINNAPKFRYGFSYTTELRGISKQNPSEHLLARIQDHGIRTPHEYLYDYLLNDRYRVIARHTRIDYSWLGNTATFLKTDEDHISKNHENDAIVTSVRTYVRFGI